jgi:hypothetical protein
MVSWAVGGGTDTVVRALVKNEIAIEPREADKPIHFS